jgi:alkylation response protein AidB-like acyl-CoA dehydrogenase
MSAVITPEQKALVEAVRGLLRDTADSESVRRWATSDSGFDTGLWKRLAEELGAHGLALPVDHDGSGASLFEQALVLEQMGAVLLGSPYLSTVLLSSTALLQCGDDPVAKDLLPRIAAGAVSVAFAFMDLRGQWASGPEVTAELTGTGYLLSGQAGFVVEADAADVLLVLARTNGALSLFTVERGDAVGVQPLTTLDLTRRQAHVGLVNAPGVLVGSLGDGATILEQVLDVARVALAAEELGGASRCLEMSVEYAKIREQFGRAIGSFQAIKHACAEMLVAVEMARSAAYHAARLADSDQQAFRLAAPTAKALASDAFTLCARQNIQIHGGIGCTWEHDAHLFYRRAESSALLLGDSAEQRKVLAARLGIGDVA